MIETKLALSEEVQFLLDNEKFVSDWKQLANKVTGFTPLQEIEFVGTWYNIYKEYEPVISIAYDEEGKLVGLMCLALHIKNRFITHAGDNSAEYHGWLATSKATSDFLANTLSLIKNKFSLKKWEWGWMPPGFPSDAFKNVDIKGINVFMESEPAPIWDLTDPEKLRNFQKSRSLKSKFNRYKKRGNYRIEIITDPERTADVLKLVSHQCDLRHAAINNSRPFEEDPNRIAFCAALQAYYGVLHVSAMWLDDQLLAFHLGISDDKRVCLGLSSYDPSESKQSPGTLLLIELSKILTEQGYETFDLTPGNDLYKERFANQHQVLSKPTITFTTRTKYTEKIKYQIKNMVMRLLPLIKTDIQAVQKRKNNLIEFLEIAKLVGNKKLFRKFKEKLFSKKTIHLYYLDNLVPTSKISKDFEVHPQLYESLLMYKNEESFRTKRRFLREALEKFSSGETLFSVTNNNELKWSGWLTNSKKPLKSSGIPQLLLFENGSHVLYDFYCSKSECTKEDLFKYLQETIDQINPISFLGLTICLEDPFRLSEEQITTLGVSSVEKIVFTNVGSFYKKRHSKKLKVASDN